MPLMTLASRIAWAALVALPLRCSFLAAIMGRTKPTSLGGAAGGAVGALLYEFLQPTLRSGTFDWNDVIGLVIGSVIALSTVWLIWLKAGVAQTSPQFE